MTYGETTTPTPTHATTTTTTTTTTTSTTTLRHDELGAAHEEDLKRKKNFTSLSIKQQREGDVIVIHTREWLSIV